VLSLGRVKVKTSTTIALALAALLSAPLAAAAQSEPPAPYHGDRVHRVEVPHHTVHHRFAAHNQAGAPAAAPAAATTAPQAAAPFGLAWPHIAPYPNGKGDEDGLSEDPNDCNKGCLDGNTPD
jgi:hypothetical protein